MAISILNNVRRGERHALSCLLMLVYLLAVNYSISHVHAPEEGNPHLAQAWSELHHDVADHWYSDQQHSHACTLIAQTAASPVGIQSTTVFVNIFNPAPRYLSLNLATPTKKHTRAPPTVKS